MPPHLRGFLGKHQFRLYDREKECFYDLTADEVQVGFLRIERFNEDGRQERADHKLPNLQRCDGFASDNGRCRFCVRGMQDDNTGE